ncbi:MAG: TlyA family rRNA (cytidine-2'-O)-methyltransferase [Litorilinea sp.]|nr:MAG: TlyA family rRNA (cytidine-2'-O)-methyltransferase [Litorilinea sp.]
MTNTPPANSTAPQPSPRRGNGKRRLDLLLVERGLAESRERARRLIMAGQVLVDEVVVDKPGKNVPADATLRVRGSLPYVSRGGLKLKAALDEFCLSVAGLTAVDVGASTGGFTDCLLQEGAAQVFAVDVGYGQLAWKLRQDARVVVLERTNIRHLEELPGGVQADLAVIDASFISLALVLPATLRLLKPDGQLIALIKPQFEAGKADVGKGGVVRKEAVHRRVLEEMFQLAQQLELSVAGLTVSPVRGPAGNVEFLMWLRRTTTDSLDPATAIPQVLQRARSIT